MRHCFNSFNANLLVPRPPSLHENMNEQRKITFYIVIKSHKLSVCQTFTVDQIYVYSSHKLFKEVAVQTLNLSRPSANANATNNRSKRAIEKREEYALSQEQMPKLPPPSSYISFEEFKRCFKSLALNKLWNIAIQEELFTACFTSSNYVLTTYEVFIKNRLLPVSYS